MEDLLLRRVRLPFAAQFGGASQRGADGSEPVDVRISGGVISRIAPSESAGSESAGTETVDAQGRFLVPGLWDEHVHFTQWVIRRQRVDLTATNTAAEVLELVRSALPTAGEQLVGFGFRDGLWPEPARLEDLDAVTGEIPTALISGDLHCMWLNTAAQRKVGVETDATGVLREGPSFAVMDQFGDPADLTVTDYRKAAQAAAARGVVGVTEFENADNARLWPQRVAAGVDQLRVRASVWPDYLERAVAAGLRTGDKLDGDPTGPTLTGSSLVTMGPLKIISDGSLNTRTAWCFDPYAGFSADQPHACGGPTVAPERVRALLATAQAAGIEAAVHAIGDRANAEVLELFAELGMAGSIEHAQLLRTEDIQRFAQLGITASVQPEHAMDDREVAEAYWPGRTQRSFPLRSLADAGVRLRLGSDAPVAPLDPWIAIAAAVTRSRDGKAPWHPEQRIEASLALAASAQGRSQVQVGDVADLALLDENPLTADGETLRSMPVAATLLGGRFAHYGL